jgi:hypothetical protein
MSLGGKRPGAGRKRGIKVGPYAKTIARHAVAKAHHELTAARVIEEIRRLALSDIGQLFDAHGRLKPLHDIPPAVRACIASVKTTKKNLTVGDGVQEDVIEVKLWDKVKALDQAGRYHGLFVERHEHTVALTLEELVAGAGEPPHS